MRRRCSPPDIAFVVCVATACSSGAAWAEQAPATVAIAEALALGLQSADSELPHKRLTDREFEIFLMLASGESVTGIAERLSLSVKTASTHKTHILEKMKLGSIAELVRYALEHGLLDFPT